MMLSIQTHVMKWCVYVCVCQWRSTLSNPTDCSLPGSSVHGILQAGILEWIATPFSRGSSRPRFWTLVSCIAGGFFTVVAFNNCFCSSCSPFIFPFSFWKPPKACLLIQCAWSSCGKAVVKISWLYWIASHHILYKVDLENVNHLLQWSHNLSRTLDIFF